MFNPTAGQLNLNQRRIETEQTTASITTSTQTQQPINHSSHSARPIRTITLNPGCTNQSASVTEQATLYGPMPSQPVQSLHRGPQPIRNIPYGPTPPTTVANEQATDTAPIRPLNPVMGRRGSL